LKILSWNVNGIRAVYKKGFLDWLGKSRADIVCLQETKAQEDQLPFDLTRLRDYSSYFNSAKKKGYGGVAVYTKEKPSRVKFNLRLKRFDQEGRFLELKYPNLTLINLYLPHGGRGKENLDYKLEVYNYLLKYLKKILRQAQDKLILVGDFNIAHKEIDLARPKENKNNIMFTPEEREQIDRIIKLGFVDSFRKFHKRRGYYTWWSYIAQARERNLGWRIDYAFVSKGLNHKLKKVFIRSKVMGSDHCPIGIELKT
jgi:exodeoxyribonuclease-3